MIKNHITYERANQLLRYEPETGKLFWKERPSRSKVIVGERAGCTAPDGYRVVKVDGVIYKEHRIAWLLMTGVLPTCDIDHVDRCRSNNRWNNLRLAPNNAKDNLQNTKRPTNNTSGVKGVSWNKALCKWAASIKAGGKPVFLGYYFDFFEAVCARKSAELVYHTFANP